jgi:hypothetical protein
MLRYALHQQLPQPLPAMRFQHEYIGNISIGGKIADHSGKANLRAATIINTKAQRMLDRPRHNFAWNAFGPIAAAQKPVDHIQIEPRGIGADQKFVSPMLEVVRYHPNILNARTPEFTESRSKRCPQKRGQLPAVHVFIRSLAHGVVSAGQHDNFMIEVMTFEFIHDLP